MEKKEKNSNVILLVVIAIATMVIVVIGATFAYLASTAADNDTANINAGFQEGSSDLLLIDAGQELSVEATYDNFGNGAGDQIKSSLASVVLQAAAGSTASYKYDVFLDTESNNMEYTAGTCYKKTSVVAGVTTQDDCVSNDNFWAKVNGSATAACYSTDAAQKVEGDLYESERGCLTSDDYMWAIDDGIAELAFNIYKPVDGVTTAADCTADPATTVDTNLGVCIDKQRNINTTATTASDCIAAGYSWTPNYFDDVSSVCYKVDKSVDITKAQTGEPGRIKLYEGVTIDAADGAAVTQSYRVDVVLVNLPHNQIANGGHTYVGRLNIKVQQPASPDTPVAGDENLGA